MPLRAIPLGRPVLAPAHLPQGGEDVVAAVVPEGPLNRAAQYGVTRPTQRNSKLSDIERDSDLSDYEADAVSDLDARDLDLLGSIPAFSRAPQGRFGLSNPPKVVPEDKEVSPDRRPGTAESGGAAPAPSVASSRNNSQRARTRPPAKLNAYKDLQHARSPSFGSVASSTPSTLSALPPYAIPTRSSSRVPAKTASEGSQSPTPQQPGGDIFGRGGQRGAGARATHAARQQSLRKTQSAAVIRPAAANAKTASPPKGRRRRKSPNLTPIQSMAFESVPTPTKFPIPGLPTPLLQEQRPQQQQQHKSFDLTKGSVDISSKRPSTAVTMDPQTSEETNLIDAIAATMVGEWMWKYVRKRSSFGIAEGGGGGGEFAGEGGTGHGTRHKRWVWLSPYERTIMWDSRQPMSGSALMGKKGRKLAIQSVLDVQDPTPVPKGAELSAAFHRSILILTPQRALKFTTVSAARHELWMTALSFLAQSGRLPAQFPAVSAAPLAPPPAHPTLALPPLQEIQSAKRQNAPAFGRATIRDSGRLAKGRRPSTQRSATQPIGMGGGAPATHGQDDGADADADAGADFPSIPRLYITTSKHRHQRKRSHTSPRLPGPLTQTLRSLSSTAVPSSSSSAVAAASSSSRLHPLSTTGSSAGPRSSSSKSASAGASRQDSITSPQRPNFFEAVVGTVRMEAFVDPSVRDGVLYVPAPPPPPPAPPVTSGGGGGGGRGGEVGGGGGGHWRRRGESNLSQSTAERRRGGYVFDELGQDPFKGF
ncbi:hypothetical protein LTR53_016739 [Teratosphaeriaceae sp. CCFEE 6253]|nr:hypothetical protein LTR53_016739 [Teratosphaeriaceae sp. CCFEE 6253]